MPRPASDMKGNPDYETALSWADMDDAPDAPAVALTFATLALAYEQRTANLLAYFNMRIAAHAAEIELTVEPEILARLGIDDAPDD